MYNTNASARWISKDTIAWIINDPDKYEYSLHWDQKGKLAIRNGKIFKDNKIDHGMEVYHSGEFYKGDDLFNKKFAYLYEHIHNNGKKFVQLKIRTIDDNTIRQILKSQYVIVKWKDKTVAGTSYLQPAGVIDNLFAYSGNDLGLSFSDDNRPCFKLWAPTATVVKLHILTPRHDSPKIIKHTACYEMLEKDNVWQYEGDSSWINKYYIYEVESFRRKDANNRDCEMFVRNFVTDPYSVNLSFVADPHSDPLPQNINYSQIINMDDEKLKPPGWDASQPPENYVFADTVIYELHVRDYSIFDNSVDPAFRGTFKAFTCENANGFGHLKQLADAGLTHVHFLPVNDVNSISEDRNSWIDIFMTARDIKDKIKTDPALYAPIGKVLEKYDIDEELTLFTYMSGLAPDSPVQQEIMESIKNVDNYNWGYDPLHYMALDGAYATNPNGSAKIFEFREMIQTLHEKLNLRVVVDVVFNHTSEKILNKIVPDYFYRLNYDGDVCNDSCCNDTASENFMMEKLIVDTVKNWCIWYKIDGFRFDLMNLLTKTTMRNIRGTLNTLTKTAHGTDGTKVFLYGEGWDFGSLKWLLPDECCHNKGASDLNIGLATFNDGFRDFIKGRGNNKSELFNPGDSFITDKSGNRNEIMTLTKGLTWDLIEEYNSPQESVNYLSAHDNHTLWDQILAKAGWQENKEDIEKLVRIQQLGISFILLSQGIPFLDAGIEILRSKSGDRDSYNSGIWFNKLDYSCSDNNWAKGLPMKEKNIEYFYEWSKRLYTIPGPDYGLIKSTFEHTKEMLKIRKGSAFFRLICKNDIQEKIFFPGKIKDHSGNFNDHSLFLKIKNGNEFINIVINTDWIRWLDFFDEDIPGAENFQLHPVLQNSQNDLLLQYSADFPDKKQAFWDKEKTVMRVPPQTCLVFINFNHEGL